MSKDKQNDDGVRAFLLELSRLIAEARRLGGLSQTELAKRAGIDQSMLSRLENCRFESVSLVTLYRIADAMGMDLEVSLVEREGE